MRPFKIVSDGPHRITETASLPGQKRQGLNLPGLGSGGPVIDLRSNERPPAVVPAPAAEPPSPAPETDRAEPPG